MQKYDNAVATAHEMDPVFTDFTQKKQVNCKAKMAIPSLSQDPATDRLMYPGTIAMNPAANSPAPGDQISFVKKYVAIAVRPL